jgi:hypothetical protein
MSDWEVGDLAVCVDDRPNPVWGPSGLTMSAVYRVTGVIFNPAPSSLYGREDWGLFLAGIDSGTEDGFCGSRFRKITPDKREACEDEFVTLLKRIRENA